MAKNLTLSGIFHFYIEGFKQMRLGKLLWLIILVKLFVIFFVLKLFFFPNFLKQFGDTDHKQNYVSSELIDRASIP